MSELINITSDHGCHRNRLLCRVSVLALTASLAMTNSAAAQNEDRPTVWITLGGQFDRISSNPESFAPPFLGEFQPLNFEPVGPVQDTDRGAFGEEGSVSITPANSNWNVSASIRYGRSRGKGELHQQLPTSVYLLGNNRGHLNLTATADNSDTFAVVDFRAGKDVGVGMFGRDTTSLLQFGVRFAQFASRRQAGLDGDSQAFQTTPNPKYGKKTFHRYYGTSDIKHSFSGIGPSLSLNASAPILGQDGGEGLYLDWGMNAAVLFGRQKASGHSSATGLYYRTIRKLSAPRLFESGIASSYHNPHTVDRNRSVVVPNVGAFAGISVRYVNAKVSFGYRADVFFNATDNGIAMRQEGNMLFHGPYAQISVGMGG